MRRGALFLTLALVLAGCKIITYAGGGVAVPADGLAATDIAIPGAPAIGALVGVNIALHPGGGFVFSSDGRVVRIVDEAVEVLYDERDPGAPITGVFARPAVKPDGTVVVPVSVNFGDTSLLFLPPGGPPSVTVLEAGSVSTFAMTSATDWATGEVYVGIASDLSPFGYTFVGRVDGTGVAAVPGSPSYPMGTILFATEAVGFDVYDGVVYTIDVWTDTISTWDSSGATTPVLGNGIEGFAGDGGPALSASFANPRGIEVVGPIIYVADSGNHRIRRTDAAGNVITIAGTGTAGLSGDDGEATDADLNDPAEVAVDDIGRVWIADDDNDRIRLVSGAVED